MARTAKARSKSLVSVEIEGYEHILAEFDRLDIKMQTKILRPALRAAGKIVKDDTVSRVRVGPTGNLKRTIKLRAKKRSRKSIGVYIATGTREELGIPNVKSAGYYPYVIEFGSRNRRSYPYMRPALYNNKSKVFAALGKKIGEGLKKHVRGNKNG